MNTFRDIGLTVTFVAISSCAAAAWASSESNGMLGIDATATGLTGAGVAIGQVEAGRPGKPGFDPANEVHSKVVPVAVFEQGLAPVADSDVVTTHGVQVAGVMISTDALLIGTSPGAQLYSSSIARTDAPIVPPQAQNAKAMQAIVLQNGGRPQSVELQPR